MAALEQSVAKAKTSRGEDTPQATVHDLPKTPARKATGTQKTAAKKTASKKTAKKASPRKPRSA